MPPRYVAAVPHRRLRARSSFAVGNQKARAPAWPGTVERPGAEWDWARQAASRPRRQRRPDG